MLHELPYELPQDVRLRILGNMEILGKSQLWVEKQPSSQFNFQKLKFRNSSQKTRKGRYQTLLFLSRFTGFLYFVPNNFEIMNSKCNLKNTHFCSNICTFNINYNAKAIQCDLYEYCVHIECNRLYYMDCKCFQFSDDPSFSATCCNAIFPFASLDNNSFLSAIYCDRFNKSNEKQVETKDISLP